MMFSNLSKVSASNPKSEKYKKRFGIVVEIQICYENVSVGEIVFSYNTLALR